MLNVDLQRRLSVFQALQIMALALAFVAAIGVKIFSGKITQQKDRQIAELETKAKQMSQGRTTAYAPNGAKRVTGPGYIDLIEDGPEVQVFEQMKLLEQQQDFPALLELTEAQIVQTPEWLTPYLLKGKALASLGRRDEAVAVFRFVRLEAPDDPYYGAIAAQFLQALRAQHP